MPIARKPRQNVTKRGITLTPREMDVLMLSNIGMGRRTIAPRLRIGEDRVKDLYDQIKLKIGLDRGATVRDMIDRARAIGFVAKP